MAQKGLWNLAGEEVLRDRGALPKEECDFIREYKAMHEENFLSSWIREDGKEKEVMLETSKETKEERAQKEEKRRGERRQRFGEMWWFFLVRFVGQA